MFYFERKKEEEKVIKEIESQVNYLSFIYGKKNVGKTTLIKHVILNKLNLKKYFPFYIDLRGKSLLNDEDFVKSFCYVSKKERSLDKIISKIKENKDVLEKLLSASLGIPFIIPYAQKEILKSEKDLYLYLDEYFMKIREKGKIPVFIVDEIQVIKKKNKESFKNFLEYILSLTKVRNLAKTLLISSDSLFITEIYLKNNFSENASFIKIDELNEKEVKDFAEKYLKESVSQKKINLIYRVFGGKPSLIKLACENFNNLKTYLRNEVEKEKNRLKVYFMENQEDFKVLKTLLKERKINFNALKGLLEKNILFYDIENGKVSFQSKLTLNALRKLIKEKENQVKIKM